MADASWAAAGSGRDRSYVAAYGRLVWYTSSLTLEPADLYDWIDNEIPIILTFWHGQHFLMPLVVKRHHRVKVMISRHADADDDALEAARRLVQERLDAVTARAEALVGRPQGSVVHGR